MRPTSADNLRHSASLDPEECTHLRPLPSELNCRERSPAQLRGRSFAKVQLLHVLEVHESLPTKSKRNFAAKAEDVPNCIGGEPIHEGAVLHFCNRSSTSTNDWVKLPLVHATGRMQRKSMRNQGGSRVDVESFRSTNYIRSMTRGGKRAGRMEGTGVARIDSSGRDRWSTGWFLASDWYSVRTQIYD